MWNAGKYLANVTRQMESQFVQQQHKWREGK
jgi:hypothetical protein